MKGRLLLKFRGGVEHLPVAEEEAQVMLFEPAGTLNTGNVTDSDRTVAEPKSI